MYNNLSSWTSKKIVFGLILTIVISTLLYCVNSISDSQAKRYIEYRQQVDKTVQKLEKLTEASDVRFIEYRKRVDQAILNIHNLPKPTNNDSKVEKTYHNIIELRIESEPKKK